MTDTTENRNYNVPQEGETDWHIPVNENWSALDSDVQELYDTVDGSTSGDTENISSKRTNVGALPKGTYHDNAYSDGGFGVVFQASDLYIDSVTVDSNLSNVSDPDLTIELRQFEGGADDPTIVDSTTVTLSGGPERVALGFSVPASGSGDPNDEYVLQRGPANNDEIPLRRRYSDDGDWSTADFNEETYTDPAIDFLQGTINAASSSASEPTGSWYYFFDWLVGPQESRVVSPRSTDVDELYMRPRDPTEEFDDVSPRALWIDTS